MFGNLGWTELLVIAGLAMLFLGQRRIPELAKGLGEGLRIFRKEISRPDSTSSSAETGNETKSAERS